MTNHFANKSLAPLGKIGKFSTIIPRTGLQQYYFTSECLVPPPHVNGKRNEPVKQIRERKMYPKVPSFGDPLWI